MDGKLNQIAGWTALHWAAHRGHEPIVRALLMRGAQKDVKNSKGQIPEDLAKTPEICALFGRSASVPETDPEESVDCKKPTFTPAYLAQPDLSKLWSLPDGSTDDPKLNQEAFTLSNPKLPTSTPVPKTATGASVASPSSAISTPVVSSDTYGAKEILVYSQSVADDNLLGAIFANTEDTIERTIQLIKEEIDDVPEIFSLGRFNGAKMIPVNTKQYSRKTGEFFRGQDDAIVLIVKSAES
ncbi:hypothetical protein BGX28_001323 [Mortierella sp. GBA30]|nr:hypothetical protein BGX28_001323 [Mortierella sp. GBA30]